MISDLRALLAAPDRQKGFDYLCELSVGRKQSEGDEGPEVQGGPSDREKRVDRFETQVTMVIEQTR